MNEREDLLLKGFVDLVGYEGFYMINTCGEVYRLPYTKRRKDGSFFTMSFKKLKLSIKQDGYLVLIISSPKRKSYLIHRAVAEAFIPNPENKPQVDHIDCNKLNNSVDNLRWCTHLENMNNPITKERVRATQLATAKSRQKAVLKFDKKGQLIERFESISEAAAKYGGVTSNISFACLGKRKSVYGFIWKHEY